MNRMAESAHRENLLSAIRANRAQERMPDAATALENNIRQMRQALVLIRDEAATKENGGSWAAGMAALCLATLQSS